MYSPRKLPWNYHPPDHMTTSLNSRTGSSPNKPKPIHSTPLNTKSAKNSLKNISRLEEFPLPNLPKQHCSSLSRRRKSGNYTPAKTTGISTATQSRMPILSPLSLTSSISSENHWFLQNSMHYRGITMSSSNQKTNKKLPSPPHLGCLNQMSCSVECATHWPHSRSSWMTFLEITLWKAGW